MTITGAIQAGTLALAINEGAYMAEIVRAGIEAIDTGQMEAAKSLGMTYGLAMRRIVLPQAAKVIIPPLGNEFNNMMKTTSLMKVISAAELFFGFTQVNARLFKPFELFIAASLYYLAADHHLVFHPAHGSKPAWASAKGSSEPRHAPAPVHRPARRRSLMAIRQILPSPSTKCDARTIVKVEHVNKYFGRLHVLNDINLEVCKNEVLVIIGPSGSGKSTFLRCINHLEKINSGRI